MFEIKGLATIKRLNETHHDTDKPYVNPFVCLMVLLASVFLASPEVHAKVKGKTKSRKPASQSRITMDVFNENFQQLASGSDRLVVTATDSRRFYVRFTECKGEPEQCSWFTGKLDKATPGAGFITPDKTNTLLSSIGIGAVVELKTDRSTQNETVSFVKRARKVITPHKGVPSIEPAISAGEVTFKVQYTPRYHDHIRAADSIRNFHLADYAGEGGFYSIPGVTTEVILDQMGREGVEGRMGLIVDQTPVRTEILGVHDLPWSAKNKSKVAVFSCALCHYGKAAGILVPGLGSKNVSPSAMAEAALESHKTLRYKIVRGVQKVFKSRQDVAIENEGEQIALRITRTLSDPQSSNLTQGLTAVNQTPLRFYRDTKTPVPLNYPRAPSKGQAMWGLGVKRAHGGQFSEAGADGGSPAWAAGFDMGSEMPLEVIQKHLGRLERVQEDFGKLLPPSYPFPIDREKAARGSVHFEKQCARCHAANGGYERDADGFAIHKPPFLVEWDEVKTEPERSQLFRGLDKVLEKHPFKALTILTPPEKRPYEGYYAPRLTGIWARFPYLHNGSVPSVMALLTPAAERPKVFSLRRAGEYDRFDPVNLGLTLPSSEAEWNELERRGKSGAQDVYDISRDEHSNEGHAKGHKLTHEQKLELIEFLKTL